MYFFSTTYNDKNIYRTISMLLLFQTKADIIVHKSISFDCIT